MGQRAVIDDDDRGEIRTASGLDGVTTIVAMSIDRQPLIKRIN